MISCSFSAGALAGLDAADVSHIALDGADGQVGSLGILLVGGQLGKADIAHDRRAGNLRIGLGVGDLLVKRRAAVGFHAGHPRAGQGCFIAIEEVVQRCIGGEHRRKQSRGQGHAGDGHQRA